ncbi:MAG: sulfatase-like hydrolase/transferase [bacterium]|nr:sulfatase-like hydrolase/transferase [bacterium]
MASLSNSRPNIVFICSDQHSFRYTGYVGHRLVKTPNLDQIAEQGVVFSNAYCGSPVCVPGRACLMTGMYPSDCGSYCNSTVWDGSHPTWGTRMSQAGYDCRATGKLDLNLDFEMGFQETDTSHGHCRRPDITSLFRRPPCYRVGERPGVDGHPREDRHGDQKRAETALSFVNTTSRSLDKPWVHYVGFSQPHPKFVAYRPYYDLYPLEDIDLPHVPNLEDLHLVYQAMRHFKRVATPISEDRIRRARAGYYGMITELDEYIGQIWKALDRTGQLENTVFIYTSDHGEALGEHGMWYKNNLFENAAHIPLVMAGPGLPKGVKVETPVAHVDLVATLLDLAGAEGETELRGHSLLPVIEGLESSHPGWTYTESHSEGNVTGSFMVRKGDWKYIHFTWYDDLLFNLAEDPGEHHNRIADPGAQEAHLELREILYSQVDPEAVTRQAFEAQDKVLEGIAQGKAEAELAAVLEGRLGAGLARVMASKFARGE